MNDHPQDPFDELMRRALHEEADRAEPSDALPEIRARAHAQRPSARRPWLLTAGVAAVGTAAAVGIFTVFTGTDNTADEGDEVAGPGTTTTATGVPPTQPPSVLTSSPEPSQAPTAATQPPTASTTASTTKTAGPTSGRPEQPVPTALVPVYWLGQQVGAPKKSSARLYRTWSRVTGRPAEQAVRIMTTKQPDDPDYFSVWRGAAVNTVTRSDGVVTVDFKQLPKTTLDPDLAKVASQQLVYTVQGALGDAAGTRIQVTEQGRPSSKLFGHVDTSQPLSRAPAADVQAFIWVTTPANGAVVTTPLKVTGTASVFEAQLNWRIVSTRTQETVAKGAANTTEAYKFTPFAFNVAALPAGSYILEVFEISAADGRMTSTDTKLVTVK